MKRLEKLRHLLRKDINFNQDDAGFIDFLVKDTSLDVVTEKVALFYEDEPFPKYDNIMSRSEIIAAAEKGAYAKSISDIIPTGGSVLELGCGTGQLTNYLGIHPSRTIVGADLSKASLRLAEEFRTSVGIQNTHFIRADIFNLPFKDQSFDVVIANGVLHHTKDTWEACDAISKKMKKDGVLIIGLYNNWGRLRTNLIRKVSHLIPRTMLATLDPIVKSAKQTDSTVSSWINDQYFHPVERSHSYDEVILKGREMNLKVAHFIPDAINYHPINTSIINANCDRTGTWLDRLAVQFAQVFINHADGGLFVTVLRNE